jgi:hypothetical protein
VANDPFLSSPIVYRYSYYQTTFSLQYLYLAEYYYNKYYAGSDASGFLQAWMANETVISLAIDKKKTPLTGVSSRLKSEL